ncbi:hypothetical protein BDW59DRAFT_129225 [Aspergillus cavernicola]|uniref:DUF4440 domain-containing protein n=1 Tax=Aspergillus cavernicola TaxID=176166 RepID=A0ABR4HRN6_9EURO
MPAIYDRIEEDLIAQERTLWTTLTSADPAPELAERLCHPESILLFPKKDIITVDQLEEAFSQPFHRFDEYDLQDVRVIVIDLMAGTITYRIRASRGGKQYLATGSSTWGQGSDGEWRLISHQETLQ